MTAQRPCWFISSVGWINVLIGLVYIGFGLYVLVAGADAVAVLLQLPGDAGKAAEVVAGKDAKQAQEAVGFFAKGLSGIIVAFALVVAGCSILQGLPNLLVGVGVVLRSNVARIFALVFAVLAVLEGLACLSASGQSSRFLYAGVCLLTYAVLTFVALLGRRASLEFSGGLQQGAESIGPEKSETMSTPLPTAASRGAPRRPIEVVLLILLLAMTATTAIFATLYLTRTSPPSDVSHVAAPKGDGKPALIENAKSTIKYEPKLGPFHEAALAGQIPRVAELLKEVDVDEPDEQGRTALMKVAANGNLRMAMFLIAMGAQPNQADKTGRTPLMDAVEKNQVGIIGVFRGDGTALAEMAAFRLQYKDLSKSGLNINLKDLPGQFAVPPLDYNAKDNTGNSAYMHAILKKHLQAAQMALPLGGGPSELWTDPKGNSLLHILIANGDWETVRLINAPSPDNFWTNCWRLGANPSYLPCCNAKQVNGVGQDPWMLAVQKAPIGIVKHLLPAPTLEDLQRIDIFGKTAVDLAASNEHVEVAAYLTRLQEELTKKAVEKDKKQG
jgi:ankyrin repeat protein